MKLKEVLYGLGFKPSPAEYPYDVETLDLPREGPVRVARWRHPRERPKPLTQAAVDALRRFLRPGDVAVDIGAHTGDTTLPLALAVGPTGLVLALEPNPYVFQVLAANAGLNPGKTNILPLQFAATAEDGVYEFEYSDPGFCNGGLHPGLSPWQHGHFFKLQVQGRNLVNYLKGEFPAELGRLRYIKVDTEGYDRAVVASMAEILHTHRPYLRAEIYKHLPAAERRGFYADLRRLGYRVHKYQDDTDPAGAELQEADLTRWSHFDLFAIPEAAAQGNR